MTPQKYKEKQDAKEAIRRAAISVLSQDKAKQKLKAWYLGYIKQYNQPPSKQLFESMRTQYFLETEITGPWDD